MRQLLITTVAALVLVGSGSSVPDTSINQAARNGEIEVVKQHLAAGTDVNAKGKYEETPLHYATLEDQRKSSNC